MPPKLIGPYRIDQVLGRGGVGTVYRALDRRTNTPVALKLLTMGPALEPIAARRLALEFEALAELSHPNVVRVFDAGVHEGYPYLAMELIEGLDLRSWLTLELPPAWEKGEISSQERENQPRPSQEFPPWDEASFAGSQASSDSLQETRKGFSEEPEAEPLDEPTFDFDVPQSLSGSDPASRSGLRALQALAWQADEPDTDEGASNSVVRPRNAPADPLQPLSVPDPTPTSRVVPFEVLNRIERVARLREAALQLCQALAYIHARGMIHRDLKPANVLVDDHRRVKLMDFGLAKLLAGGHSVTGAGRIVGTYRYVAPELILGEPLDGRADLYSLGVLLFELLCGQAPHDAPTPPALWRKVLETEAPLPASINPGVEPNLAAIAYRLLRKDPEDRFQTAEEVYEALQE